MPESRRAKDPRSQISYSEASTDPEEEVDSQTNMSFVSLGPWCRMCWQKNSLAILCCLFGLFWCTLAIVMILLYTNLLSQTGKSMHVRVPWGVEMNRLISSLLTGPCPECKDHIILRNVPLKNQSYACEGLSNFNFFGVFCLRFKGFDIHQVPHLLWHWNDVCVVSFEGPLHLSTVAFYLFEMIPIHS